jgi:hypothetical protein
MRTPGRKTPMRTSHSLISFSFAAAILSACASSPSGGGTVMVGPDAGTGTPPASGGCLVPNSFGDLGSISPGTAVVVPQDKTKPTGPQIVLFNVQFTDPANPSAKPDILHFEFWQGLGAFTAGFRAGTFAVSGDETDFFKCSACAVVAGDFDTTTGIPGKTYMASSGSITLTKIDPTVATGKLTGSVTGLHFVDVDVSGQAQVALTDGCSTAVDNLTFDLTVQAPQ